MSLSRQTTKYIHPVLKDHGFLKTQGAWKRSDGLFYFIVEVGSSKHGTDKCILELDIGVFSVEIEELYGQRLKLGLSMEDMPGGVMLCHFMTSIFQISDDLQRWESNLGVRRFFQCEADVSGELEGIAAKLNAVLPRFIAEFGSVEKIVALKEKGVGFAAKSSLSKLQAACGCVVLGRYDQAKAFIRDAIKAGSGPFEREIADRLHHEIEIHMSRRE